MAQEHIYTLQIAITAINNKKPPEWAVLTPWTKLIRMHHTILQPDNFQYMHCRTPHMPSAPIV